MATPSWRGTAAVVMLALGSLAITTLIVAVLEGDLVGIDDASAVYLVAVVAVGAVAGTAPAVATAIALYGPGSGAALATVVGVLVEVPVMLSVCRFCVATRGWFEPGGAHAPAPVPSSEA